LKLSVKPRAEPDVNLTSLIDVVLLLLVFFMVSTTFVKQSEISIQLPQAESAERPAPVVERIEIMITEQGTFLINGRELINNRPETIRNGLRKVSEGDTTLPLTISADADARHQDVVTAMDVAGRLGFVQISLATVNDPTDRP
jgi:biopolymer transport protein ExbD